MTESLTPPSKRVRIAGHITQSRFLHVEDVLGIGKVRIFAGTYKRGQGMVRYSSHYLDLADARIVFQAMMNGERGFSYKEYKGTPPRNDRGAPSTGQAVSRALSVVVKGDNVYIELKRGPGQLTPTGSITPDGKPQAEINVGFKLYEARRLAATVLAYIHAWDVHRIMAQHFMLGHQQLVGQPGPYLLTATEAAATEAVGSEALATEALATETVGTNALATADSGLRKEGFATGPQTGTRNGNRPITRKSRAKGGQAAAPARPAVPAAVEAMAEAIYGSGALRYGDGTAVDDGNLAEVQAFQWFVAENKNAPASRAILQAYYREHMTT